MKAIYFEIKLYTKWFKSNLWFLIFRKARIKECNNTRKTHIYGTEKRTPLQNFTLIPMVQTVFENFEILTKIIHPQSSLHFERIFQSTFTLLDPNST